MKSFALMAAALVLGFTLTTGDAEAARRLGGGSSSGMQRQAVTPNKATNAAPTQNQAAPAAAPQAQPKRSWMGPLAGLAAGLGLAALASHFGFGEGLANMMMIGLLVMGAVMLFGFLMRKKAASAQPGMQYANANAGYGGNAAPQPDFIPAGGSAAAPAANAANSGNIPAGFDVDGFVRNAKVNFIRLQAANDAGNLEDIREFTSPEMFAEIKLGMAERGAEKQETDVVQLNAEVLDVAEEASRYVVSVRFTGLIREEKNAAPEAFDEMWHMTKPRSGNGGWVLAGIQQVQ
ncbi:Tim44 domain-containing protein [Quatrionicoccus australiensis]|uniref:Tim44 domain-containing protein n=1 Tax=Quatrionicoccus australiensis TaxID=138118 RepID=UPI001CFBA158|nr:TIM44-like domain-containing protein [Quatrionicoccus australiensis]MCB4359898.1 Tim44 domain-containing protein [Quatrionicoccus australiensis]